MWDIIDLESCRIELTNSRVFSLTTYYHTHKRDSQIVCLKAEIEFQNNSN